MILSKERLASKREDILNALRSAGRKGLTNQELSKIALRYGGYIGLLYEAGYVINKINLKNGLFKYILVSEPKEELKIEKSAFDLLKEKVDEYGLVDSLKLDEIIERIGVSVRYNAGTHKKRALLNKQIGEVI